MEPKGSLPYSQAPATCPYPEPARSNPYPTSYLLKIHHKIILPSMPGSPKWLKLMKQIRKIAEAKSDHTSVSERLMITFVQQGWRNFDASPLQCPNMNYKQRYCRSDVSFMKLHLVLKLLEHIIRVGMYVLYFLLCKMHFSRKKTHNNQSVPWKLKVNL